MPITPFLIDQAFDPDTQFAMGIALAKLCQSLGLPVERTNPATRLLAMRIIEVAKMGERDSDKLYVGVRQWLESAPWLTANRNPASKQKPSEI